MDETWSERSYHAILKQRQVRFDGAIDSGEISPWIFPHSFLPLIFLILALLIPWPPRGLFKYTRYLSFCCILYFAVLELRRSRSLVAGNGYAVGLMAAWMIIWGARFLLFNDVRTGFARVERSIASLNAASRREILNTEQSPGLASEDLLGNGEVVAECPQSPEKHGVEYSGLASAQKPPIHRRGESVLFRWQPYPQSFPHRLTWVWDLVTSLRGSGWNFRISTLPPLPSSILAQLHRHSSEAAQGEALDLTHTKRALRSAFIKTALNYMYIDFLKVAMMHDPYFWGKVSAPPPWPFDSFGTIGKFLCLVYRLSLTLLGVSTAVKFLASVNTLIFLAVSLLPQARRWTSVPLEAWWLYPDQFGPFLSAVLDHGLQGVWGRWWHQLLRIGVLAPSAWISAHLPRSLQRSTWNRVLQIFIAFTLSGFVHACGSYCQFASTRPLSGSFLFFFLQAPAMIFQTFVAGSVTPLLSFRPARWVRRLTNVVFVAVWLLLTGPLVADDFAKGGIWLVEPVPLSPLRGFGLGAEDEGWWCWHGKWFRQWQGTKWWEVGVQIL